MRPNLQLTVGATLLGVLVAAGGAAGAGPLPRSVARELDRDWYGRTLRLKVPLHADLQRSRPGTVTTADGVRPDRRSRGLVLRAGQRVVVQSVTDTRRGVVVSVRSVDAPPLIVPLEIMETGVSSPTGRETARRAIDQPAPLEDLAEKTSRRDADNRRRAERHVHHVLAVGTTEGQVRAALARVFEEPRAHRPAPPDGAGGDTRAGGRSP